MSEPVLQVKGLKTYYYTEEGVVPAVDGLDFEVEPGETFAIVGESGCGKSVTSLSILRLIPSPPGKIIDGEIIYHGQDLVKKSEREMRSIRGNDISMIFQEPMTSLNPVFTVGQQIGESFRFHQQMGKAEMLKKSIEMLRLVGIPEPEHVINDYPNQLSGGMRQRVMIAMALACNPKILIADEPTTALDVTIQAQIMRLLKQLQEKLECFGTARKMVGDARFTVVDDYTVSLTLDHSAIMLLDMLAGAAQAAVIYPVESIEAVNADTGYVPADYIIGTGPYMFKEWAVDQYVLLERFDDYAAYGDPDQPIDGLWGYKHAYTKTLKYWIVKDAATRFNGLMSGEYDFIVKATDAYLGTLRSMPDITCYSMQTGMINLVWNKHSTDKYLRLAFQALANADDLNTANYGSLYDNDPCFMEKSQPGWYTTKGEEFFCQNDPEKAKELLAQSSFDTSKPLRILTATGGGAEAMLEVLRQEAAKIGVTLEITATDRTTMTSMRNDETLYDAYFTTFSSVAVPSLRNFLSADYAGWSDDEHLQELMLQMTTAATKEAAFAAWEEIQYYCYSDYCPILMMGHFHQAAACTNRLTGYNVFLTTNFWNAKLAK